MRILEVKERTPLPHLIVAEKENEFHIAFMGRDGQKLEMLFVSCEERGKPLSALIHEIKLANQ